MNGYRALAVAAALCAAGCDGGEVTEDGGMDGVDGGPPITMDGGRDDAATPMDDAGPVTEDGGPGGEDGGAEDGGPAPTDGGLTDGGATDGGPAPTDGGPTPTDGGPTTSDGGPAPTDAGPATCPDVDLGMAVGLSVATGTTVGAGNDLTSSCGGSGGSEDVAHLWTAPSTGRFTFDTFDSDYDTALFILMGGTCTGTEIECNDDAAVDSSTSRSRIQLDLTAGDVLVIVVDGYASSSGTSEGNYVLNITEATADEGGLCTDGLDNDRDGDADCDDFDCAPYLVCIEADCTNGLDDDADGDVDCADFDCGTDAACDTCPDVDLMGTTGTGVATGSNTTAVNRREPSTCASSTGGGAEVTFEFTASATGEYTFSSEGSDYDTVLYLLGDDCHGVEMACDDDSGTGTTSTLTASLAAGETVIVVLDAYDSADTGNYSLDITFAAMSYARPSAAGDIVITEIMQNPDGTDSGREWFEVTNTTSSTLDLGTCTVRDATATGMFVIAGPLLANPGEHLVFAQSATPGGFTPSYVYAGAFILNNGAETLTLSCGAPAATIDAVAYDGGPSFPDPDGKSMSLDPGFTTATGNDVGANWCEAPPIAGSYDAVNGGSPGRPNPSCF